MIFTILGAVAYLLFFLYDINSIIMKNKLLNCCFFSGILLLTTATAGIILSSAGQIRLNVIRTSICGLLAAVFFALLIYTLFFALPFKDTYLEKGAAPKVYQNGVYALCRHPGVLWFIGMYLFMGLTLQLRMFYIASAIFSCLNLLYVIFQDGWTFMRTFPDYKQYKQETPFLLPNISSIQKCFKTISL